MSQEPEKYNPVKCPLCGRDHRMFHVARRCYRRILALHKEQYLDKQWTDTVCKYMQTRFGIPCEVK